MSKNKPADLTKSGQPHATTASRPMHPDNQPTGQSGAGAKSPVTRSSLDSTVPRGPTAHYHAQLPGGAGAKFSPTAVIFEEMGRKMGQTWDPADPESMFWDNTRKFTIEKKFQFLDHLTQYGIIGHSANFVGVTPQTVLTARKADATFDAAVNHALERHRDNVVATIKTQAITGIPEYKWDRDGNLIGLRFVFETRLREKILDRYAPEFNAVQKQEIAVQGGAVLVPAPTADVADWDSVVAQLQASPNDGPASLGMPSPASHGSPVVPPLENATTSPPAPSDPDSFDAYRPSLDTESESPDQE